MKIRNSSASQFQESPFYEVLAKITQSHQITEQEQAIFREVFLEQGLTEEEHKTINRLYYALRRGKIKVVTDAACRLEA